MNGLLLAFPSTVSCRSDRTGATGDAAVNQRVANAVTEAFVTMQAGAVIRDLKGMWLTDKRLRDCGFWFAFWIFLSQEF
jgi:hypothetical protein